ncbi:amidohydrolase family protein [Salinibacterium sp. M195]|uniref:amidohydrolase family protein n=1 Tax=Salinibacterium sp. M195 TaxID=2583374 RepID=UPI001C62CEE0|nr:amidohydrolase family protein [Salinibacterium sp. M195]QYH35094.1 amidohydrolase [Salinibacterium sp. M195]
MNENSEIAEHISELSLIDHHVHGTLIPDLSRSEFESHLTESSEPIPPWMTQFDSQVGFAVRKYCAPHFDLPEHASADSYWAARAQWGSDEIARRLLRTSGISESIVDTGVIQTEHSERSLTTLEEFGTLAAQRVHEVVRLETLLEGLVTAGVGADALEDAFDAALAAAATTAVGFKSIIAYRFGFDFDPARPHRDDFTTAAQEWLTSTTAGPFRVSHPVLLRALLWKAVSTGLPVQLHAGYGDADIDLERCNPLLLTPWLRLLPADYSDVMLLHCYPYHREAGYLAQVFSRVYFDVGLAINYSGAASDRVIAESLELAPFSKVLFSTDAWGLPELHSIGAALWRRGMTRVLSHLVDDGDWSLADAKRVASLTGRDNAQRVYQLPTS